MNASKPLVLTMLIGAAAFSANTQAQSAVEHTQYHPDGAASAPAQTTPPTPEQSITAMDRQLQLMRNMSRKLAETKTPQERQAVMAEHQKTMQESVKLMGQMTGMPIGGMGMMGGAGMLGSSSAPLPAAGSGTAPPAAGMGPQMMQRHAIMEKRMEMMQAIMQMMIDRMPAP
ncbi:hypothetical protein [Aquabacterium sp. A08]|uniref:hypothetical protein n=1 Tax=Aquabacterium sp. A08 TaxID=2718532 RepID=UPI0014221860|nr:hypothetical protein [Aquabacterium sp. A08]NIC40768.1 hypothetical protein [Aquabacterium sp. A08]